MAGRRVYPDEFRARAVRTVFEREGEHSSRSSTIASVAAEFGVSREALRTWVRQSEVDGVPVPVYEAEEPGASSQEPERPALRLVRQAQPARKRPPSDARPSDATSPDALARHRRLRTAEPVEIDDAMTSDAEPAERVTRLVPWSELEQAADDANDLDAIVRTELERLGDVRPSEPARREPPTPRRWSRWAFVVIAVAATAATAAILVPQVGDRSEPAAQPSSPEPSAAAPSPTPSTTRSPRETAPPADDTIVARLTLSGPCWVEVVADGRPGVRATLSDGTRTFRADQTLDLTLGNAGAARLTVNGRTIETGAAGEVVHLSFALRRGTVVEG